MSDKIILKFVEKLTLLTKDGRIHWVNVGKKCFSYECSVDVSNSSHNFKLTASGLNDYEFRWVEKCVSIKTTNLKVTRSDCEQDIEVMLQFCKAVSGNSETITGVNKFLANFNMKLDGL